MAINSPSEPKRKNSHRQLIRVLAQGVSVVIGAFAASLLVGNLLWTILGYDFAVAFQWALFVYLAYRALRPKAPSATSLDLGGKKE